MTARVTVIRARRRDRELLAALRNNPAWGPLTVMPASPTLRDMFATDALRGLLPGANGVSFGPDSEGNNLRYARVAFALADAMLKARAE